MYNFFFEKFVFPSSFEIESEAATETLRNTHQQETLCPFSSDKKLPILPKYTNLSTSPRHISLLVISTLLFVSHSSLTSKPKMQGLGQTKESQANALAF